MNFCIHSATWLVLFLFISIPTAQVIHSGSHNDLPAYASYVRECLDNLMEFGTDTYGKIHTPILVSIIDIDSLKCPENPIKSDEYYRVTRRERRNPSGANLLADQPLLKTMRFLSHYMGDNNYAKFAYNYENYYLNELIDEKGFIWWGWHRHYDVYKDLRDGHAGNHHEIHTLFNIDWESLWNTNPAAVEKEINAIWKWQVINKKTGEINRHGDGLQGCDFTMSAGAIFKAFVFMHLKTNDQAWMDRANLITNYYWNRRNTNTNLIPERPNAGTDRFDGSTFVTSVTGMYCYSLLKSYEISGNEVFLKHALAYLKAYFNYGYDESTEKFWGALQLDGTPIPGPRIYTENIDSEQGYFANQPRGHLDLWEPYVLGYQYAIYTAQAYIYAYELSGDEDMLDAASKFANWIITTPPGSKESENTWYSGYSEFLGKEGTYAGKYGRSISFFLHLYIATGKIKYKQHAVKMADEAIDKLYYNGFFRGHPSKNYSEAIDGIGFLLYALLQLDHVIQNPKGAIKNRGISIGANQIKMPLDNW